MRTRALDSWAILEWINGKQPEGDRRQEDIDRAITGIRDVRMRTGRITVDELLSAREEGRKS